MASAANVKFYDEVLINVVQRYPCLWNKKLKEFKDIKVRSNAWKEVAEEMDSNGKYTVTFLTTSAAYRPTLWTKIKFDYIFLKRNRHNCNFRC